MIAKYRWSTSPAAARPDARSRQHPRHRHRHPPPRPGHRPPRPAPRPENPRRGPVHLHPAAPAHPLPVLIVSDGICWIRTQDGTLWLAPEKEGWGIIWGYSGNGCHTLARLIDALLEDISAPAIRPGAPPHPAACTNCCATPCRPAPPPTPEPGCWPPGRAGPYRGGRRRHQRWPSSTVRAHDGPPHHRCRPPPHRSTWRRCGPKPYGPAPP